MLVLVWTNVAFPSIFYATHSGGTTEFNWYFNWLLCHWFHLNVCCFVSLLILFTHSKSGHHCHFTVKIMPLIIKSQWFAQSLCDGSYSALICNPLQGLMVNVNIHCWELVTDFKSSHCIFAEAPVGLIDTLIGIKYPPWLIIGWKYFTLAQLISWAMLSTHILFRCNISISIFTLPHYNANAVHPRLYKCL